MANLYRYKYFFLSAAFIVYLLIGHYLRGLDSPFVITYIAEKVYSMFHSMSISIERTSILIEGILIGYVFYLVGLVYFFNYKVVLAEELTYSFKKLVITLLCGAFITSWLLAGFSGIKDQSTDIDDYWFIWIASFIFSYLFSEISYLIVFLFYKLKLSSTK